MLPFLARRVAGAVLVLVAVVFLTFTIGYLAPGDPARLILGSQADPESVARLRSEYGLDRDFLSQAGLHLVRMASGDLGYSYRYQGVRVGDLLRPTVPVTFRLALTSLAISLIAGVILGILCALRRGALLDRFIVGVCTLFSSVPVFVLSLVFLHMASGSALKPLGDSRLAAVVLAIYPCCLFLRLTRSSVADILHEDYIKAARARGLPSVRVIGHALANALPLLLTAAGSVTGGLMAGTFFVERIFRVPGMASFAVSSVMARDYPVMLAVTVVFAATYVMANLLADLASAAIDPRLRRGG